MTVLKRILKVLTSADKMHRFRTRSKTRNPAIAEGPRDAGVPVEIW